MARQSVARVRVRTSVTSVSSTREREAAAQVDRRPDGEVPLSGEAVQRAGPNLGKSFGVYGMVAAVGRLGGLILVPLYARVLSPEQFGTFDLIASGVALVGILGMLQLDSAVARFYNESRNAGQFRVYFSTALWTVVGASGALLCASGAALPFVAATVMKRQDLLAAMALALIGFPLNNVYGLFTIAARFLERPGVLAVATAIQVIVLVGSAVGLVWFLKWGVLGAFLALLMGSLAGTVVLASVLQSNVGLCWDRLLAKRFLRYSLPQVPAVGSGWINNYANRFVMLHFLALGDIGLLGVAGRAASLFYLGGTAFRMAWGPFFWRSFDTPDHLAVVRRSSFAVSWIVFLTVGMFAFMSPQIVSVLGGSRYASASSVVGLLAFAAGLLIVNETVAVGADVRMRMELATGIGFVAVLANVGSLFWLVPRLGLVGVGVALVVGNSVLVVLSWILTERLYGVGYRVVPFVVAFLSTLGFAVMSGGTHQKGRQWGIAAGYCAAMLGSLGVYRFFGSVPSRTAGERERDGAAYVPKVRGR